MGAYHNALREEGSRGDLLTALEKAWEETGVAEDRANKAERFIVSLGYEPCDLPLCNCESWHKVSTVEY